MCVYAHTYTFTGKDLLTIKQHEEGAVLQALTAKLRYSQAQARSLQYNNKNLSKALKAERTRKSSAPNSKSGATRMPDLAGARSVSGTCMYVYMYVCIYIYILVHACVHVCICTFFTLLLVNVRPFVAFTLLAETSFLIYE